MGTDNWAGSGATYMEIESDSVQYERFAELPALVAQKLISARRHPYHPITIYNYTAAGQSLPISQWTEALKDCRGLILDDNGAVVGRPFRKFWNYEQMQGQIPDGTPQVWEKLDGSLGIACNYGGELICATRGSFESTQARWFAEWMRLKHPGFTPSGETYLFELIYPENRIVVDYGGRKEAVLLSVMAPDGVELWRLFDTNTRFRKALRFDGITDYAQINSDPRFAGQEGFVLQWPCGFRAKAKLNEYCRIHRLITQCSTRTIWELLRTGTGVQELLDRVPVEFATWVQSTADNISAVAAMTRFAADVAFDKRPHCDTRKDFAQWALNQPHHKLLFLLEDDRDISEQCWKMAEPAWALPFRSKEELN